MDACDELGDLKKTFGLLKGTASEISYP